MACSPARVLLYLVFKNCIFDGWWGWYYTLQRLMAEVLTALEIVDQRLRNNSPPVVTKVETNEEETKRTFMRQLT